MYSWRFASSVPTGVGQPPASCLSLSVDVLGEQTCGGSWEMPNLVDFEYVVPLG